MASPVNAVDVIFSIGDVVVGCTTGASFSVTRAMDSATCGASGQWSSKSPGRMDWTGSVSANYRKFSTGEEATNVGIFDIFEILTEGTLIDVEYGTKVTGDKRFKGQAYVSGLTYDQPEEGVVTWSADLDGEGPLGVVVVPA